MAELVHYGVDGKEYFLIDQGYIYINFSHHYIDSEGSTSYLGFPLTVAEARNIARALTNAADIKDGIGVNLQNGS